MLRFCLSAAAVLAVVWSAGPARAQDCPVSYSEFEDNIPHLDLPACPRNNPDPDKAFCRLVMDGDDAYVYVFTFTDDEPCLSDIREADTSVYLMGR